MTMTHPFPGQWFRFDLTERLPHSPGAQLRCLQCFLPDSCPAVFHDDLRLCHQPGLFGAILDRFIHHAEVIQLTGRSFRMHDRQQRRAAAEKTLVSA